MRSTLQQNLKGAMDPAFESLYAAADALGGTVDYLRVALDSEAGQCMDFESDPYVVAIMPDPMDYFR
eukprot:3463760-Rhodomonas_salina.1